MSSRKLVSDKTLHYEKDEILALFMHTVIAQLRYTSHVWRQPGEKEAETVRLLKVCDDMGCLAIRGTVAAGLVGALRPQESEPLDKFLSVAC